MRKRIFLIIAMAFFSLTSFTAGEVNNVSTLATYANTTQPPVSFTIGSSNLSVKAGTDIAFYLKCTGSLPMTIKVYKNGKAIDLNPRIIFQSTTEGNTIEFILIILDVVPEDSGVYSVVIENAYGRCQEDFRLNVTD